MTDTENNEIIEPEDEFVTLINEAGEEEVFWHVLTFPYEGAKYCALVPEDQADSDEPEVFFAVIRHDKTGDVYDPVENEVLIDELFEEFESLLDEMDEEDE